MTWEIDIFDARDPLPAARKARAHQCRRGTIATVFTVHARDGRRFEVDLHADIGEQVLPLDAPLELNQPETQEIPMPTNTFSTPSIESLNDR